MAADGESGRVGVFGVQVSDGRQAEDVYGRVTGVEENCNRDR